MSTNVVIPEHEIPQWMKQARRGVDWGVLLIIGFSLLFAWPYAVSQGLPQLNATESYVFRAADIAAAFEEGNLYPRWSPHALNGYGAPIPNYYPPGAAHIAGTIDVLFANNIVLAIRLIYIAAFMFAGTMTYVLVLQSTHAKAGVIAALLYVCSPYVGLTVPHILGELPEMMGLALLPLLLWAVNRLLLHNQPSDSAYIALSTAILLVTEPRYLIIGVVFSGALIGLHMREHGWSEQATNSVVALFIGTLLAAFYWLPALFEQSAIQWQEPFDALPKYRLALADLLRPAQSIDPSALIHQPQFRLGTALLIFTILSGVLMLWRKYALNLQMLLMAMGIVLLGFILVFIPEQTWLLGPISLCLAIGSSALVDLGPPVSRLTQRFLFIGVLTAIFALSIPIWLNPPTYDAFGDTSPAAQINYERNQFGTAVLAPGQPVPTTLEPNVQIFSILQSQYLNNNPNRLSATLGAENQISVFEEGTHIHRYQVRITDPMTVQFLQSYFPAWQAQIDGQTIPIERNLETGLMRFTLPENSSGLLIIQWVATPIQRFAWVLSAVALCTIVIVLWRRWRQPHTYYDNSHLLSRWDARYLLMALLVIATLIILVRSTNAFDNRQPTAGSDLERAIFTRTPTEAHIQLLAYHISETRLHPGSTIDLTLYWQASQAIDQNYHVNLILREIGNLQPNTIRIAQRPPAFVPTQRWLPNRYVADRYRIQLPGDIATGPYNIDMQLLPCDLQCNEDNPVIFFAPDNEAIGTTFSLPRTLVIE